MWCVSCWLQCYPCNLVQHSTYLLIWLESNEVMHNYVPKPCASWSDKSMFSSSLFNFHFELLFHALDISSRIGLFSISHLIFLSGARDVGLCDINLQREVSARYTSLEDAVPDSLWWRASWRPRTLHIALYIWSGETQSFIILFLFYSWFTYSLLLLNFCPRTLFAPYDVLPLPILQ